MLESVEKKRVRWLDQKQEFKELLPQFKKSKSLNFYKIKTQLINLLRREENYEKILPSFVQELLPYNKVKEEFFHAQGHNVLSYLLVHSGNMKALELIKDLFTNKCLKIALAIENSKCLKDFLIYQSSQETFGKDDVLSRELRIEKNKFLLKLDYFLVKNYFRNADQDYITIKIKEDFEYADQEIKATQAVDQLNASNSNTLEI